MIKPNDFTSANRQDDLLMRLKQCVGSIQNSSKDIKKASSMRPDQSFLSKQRAQDYLEQRKNEPRSSYRQFFGGRQNFTDKKNHIRVQDFRQMTGDKQNSHVLKMTKNYLDNTQQHIKPYRTDRKQSLPLTENSNFSNTKRQIFVKDVSDSTKKRIAQRESLINGECDGITPIKLPERHKDKFFNENDFLERLSLRKISYLDQSDSRKQSNFEDTQQKSKRIVSQKQKPINFSNEKRSRQSIESSSQTVPLEKYQKYSKIAMENLVKDHDLKKAEKMQKLKKITNMNEEINKKIRKMVDTFENYLTHREI